MPVAVPLDVLTIALTHVAGIAQQRVFFLLSARDPESGLPPYLSPSPGLNSGLMVAQYTAAACCNELAGLCMPASVINVPTSAGIEDYNSFGPRAAAKARRALELTRTVVAIELLCAAQALDDHRPLRSGVPGRSRACAHPQRGARRSRPTGRSRPTSSHRSAHRRGGRSRTRRLQRIRSAIDVLDRPFEHAARRVEGAERVQTQRPDRGSHECGIRGVLLPVAECRAARSRAAPPAASGRPAPIRSRECRALRPARTRLARRRASASP